MLEFKNVSYVVGDKEKEHGIVKNIDLKLEDDKIYVITGPNGGGKSSLCKLIMGIYRPTSGEILFENTNITEASVTERANMKMGYAFQQPPCFKGITVKEILELASKDNDVNINSLLTDVGLCPKDYLDREINDSLSGGELKRIEIASVMGRDLKLAVFDEPEAGIDLWSFEKLVETFKKLKQRRKVTIVIVSHQERIIDLADEVIVLSKGKIEKKVSKDAIISDIRKKIACDFCNTCEGSR